MKALFATATFTVCCAATALAQQDVAQAPPPVESMTCEQMTAEITAAGQRMSAQLDPEFAREAQAMSDQAQQASRGQGQAPQGARAQAQAAEANRARHEAQTGRLNASMEGLDQQRLMALSERFEAEGCEVPQ
jgi:hypothetical protein